VKVRRLLPAPSPLEVRMMKLRLSHFVGVCLILFSAAGLSVSVFSEEVHKKLDDRINEAKTVIDQIMATPDKAIPDDIAHKAMCVAVVPNLVKGAFVVGGEYGQGVVTCRIEHGWSAPVFIRMAGGSFGFQIGGEGTDLVLVALNHKGLEDLLKDKFKIGGDASAAAGPVGRNAQASTDLEMKAELLTWSRSRGVFAGIDLSGVSVSQNGADTEDFYGKEHTYEQILMGKVPAPMAADPFLSTVAQYFGKEHSDH
jgi:lipid-binding SYLF domain-containing protein